MYRNCPEMPEIEEMLRYGEVSAPIGAKKWLPELEGLWADMQVVEICVSQREAARIRRERKGKSPAK